MKNWWRRRRRMVGDDRETVCVTRRCYMSRCMNEGCRTGQGTRSSFIQDSGVVTSSINNILHSLESAIRKSDMIHPGCASPIMVLVVTKEVATIVILDGVGKSVIVLKYFTSFNI